MKYLNSAFKENKGLEKIWSKIPLDNIASTNGALSSKDLLFQLSEYIFLNKLSMHLIAYFGNTKVNKKKLRTYKRNDIPQVLLQNAFLELFTKSMNQRAAFIDSFKTKADPRIIQISTETDGHLYENLILTLPKKCKIEKPSKTELNIKTKKLSINTRFSISGWESIENDNFLKYYAGVSDSSDIRKYTLDLNVQVKFSFISYFSNLGWTYFKWIDSFINTFSSEFSENIFKSRINWNTINTIAIMNENSKKTSCNKS